MSVISISITESDLEIVSGVPATVLLETNVPATIFYTLDGSIPTVASSVVVGAITLPTNQTSVTLKAYATDGVDSSAVISWGFGPSIVGARKSHSTVSGLNDNTGATYPFGSSNTGEPGIYGNAGGVTVDAVNVDGTSSGFDGSGAPTAYTDQPYDIEHYEIVFSESNAIGERGRGIGTLPANATVYIPPSQETPAASSDTNSPLFDAQALVIFQDNTQEPYDASVPQLMRSNFDLSNPGIVRYGAGLFTTALEGNTLRGSDLKPQFNPRDNTITYYYRDAETNRWIISKTKYVPRTPDVNDYSRIVTGSRKSGDHLVFRWIPFMYRRLL